MAGLADTSNLAVAMALLAACTALLWGLRQRNVLARLRRTLDGMDQGALLLDAADRVLYWNTALVRLRGVSAGHLRAGMSFADFLAASESYCDALGQPVPAGSPWHSALAPGERVGHDINLVNGVALQARASRAADRSTLLTYLDVGPVKQSELAYRDLATRLAATLDSVLDAIITIDERGTIDSFSAGAEQMFGYSAGEVVGRNVSLLMADGYRDPHDGVRAEQRHPGVPHLMHGRREVEARRKNGQLFPIEVGVTEMRVGGQRRFIGTLRDVTERQRVERMQHEFVATVSHELRTPLTSIMGALALLPSACAAEPGSRAQRLFDIAARNGRRLQQLIDDILNAAKSGVESLDVSLEPQSLAEISRQAVEAHQAYAARFDVRLLLQPVTEDITGYVDAGRMQQVLGNLISNAIKFSPRGESVAVQLVRDGRFALLEVADHGPGIPESFRPHLFQKFWQADASDSRARGGTGLGLYIARNLVERMHGQIECDSVVNRGTTFRVRLPLHQHVAAPITAALAP
ncbi:MAG: PAS domain S-box protein [Gammaproteobacteria bacterium]|nr:PAS domain S-box protein [Gammaproteobacteria bacterium]